MNEFYKRVERRRAMDGYLSDVSFVLGKEVDESELLDVDKTQVILERVNLIELDHPDLIRLDREFSFLRSEEFFRLVSKIKAMNDSGVYLWFERTNVCGYPPVASIDNIRFDFSFDFAIEGHFSLQTEDLMDHLDVDWSENRFGRKMVEVRLGGKSWGKLGVS